MQRNTKIGKTYILLEIKKTNIISYMQILHSANIA